MADEGLEIINISNKEQQSFCVKTVGDNFNFNVDEDFLGFYEISNVKSETVFKAIKDILLRFYLDLNDCRGQTYNGTSNMMGKYTGVLTKISAEQHKAIETHFQLSFRSEILDKRLQNYSKHHENRLRILQKEKKCLVK